VVALVVGAVLAVGGAYSTPGNGPFPASGLISPLKPLYDYSWVVGFAVRSCSTRRSRRCPRGGNWPAPPPTRAEVLDGHHLRGPAFGAVALTAAGASGVNPAIHHTQGW
jgi:hypothetical protein